MRVLTASRFHKIKRGDGVPHTSPRLLIQGVRSLSLRRCNRVRIAATPIINAMTAMHNSNSPKPILGKLSPFKVQSWVFKVQS
jgi:hypothetical protein